MALSRRYGAVVVVLLVLVGACFGKDKRRLAITDPAKAGPDFAIQGEYVGEVDQGGVPTKFGIQVIALGDGKFHAVGYWGGLPGDGWDGSDKIHAEGKVEEGKLELVAEDGYAIIKDGVATLYDNSGSQVGKLRKVHRKSPTLGKKPPKGAVVLFDGTSTDNFVKGKMTPDGLLMEGAISKQRFGSCVIHLEFRTPFMPYARGQGRGNSGCYVQGRYEVQILDSFGLEGRDNECGGIYRVAKPKVNMCFPPLSWQTYDIDFTAAEYDKQGKLVKPARMTVWHNGVLIHKDVELKKATPGNIVPDGPEPGPGSRQSGAVQEHLGAGEEVSRAGSPGKEEQMSDRVVTSLTLAVVSCGLVCFAAEPTGGAKQSASDAWLPIQIAKEPDGLEVNAGGKLFFRYLIRGGPKPFCWPIIGPGGQPMTRAYPMRKVEGEAHDHPHQRSMWFTHGDVNGIDFWKEGDDAGRQVHRRFLKVESGEKEGRFWAVTDWIGPDGKKVCEDLRKVTVRATPKLRIMDWSITVAATEGPVRFGDTKEGTFGLRVASSIRADRGGLILNANGQTNRDAWGKRATWVDYSGTIAGERVGVAIMDHPTSFRHPTYWHVRTYGLFAANPFGLHHFLRDRSIDASYTLKKDDKITFRYRVLFHLGDAKSADIAQQYEAYAKSKVD